MAFNLSDWKFTPRETKERMILAALRELADDDGFAPSTQQWNEVSDAYGLPRYPSVCKLFGVHSWRQVCAIAGLRYQLRACFSDATSSEAMASIRAELEQAAEAKQRERMFRGLDVFETPRRTETVVGRTCDGRMARVVRTVWGVR